jgi:N-acetyl-anhydromuramyl-L-alanine amidase AmpD
MICAPTSTWGLSFSFDQLQDCNCVPRIEVKSPAPGTYSPSRGGAPDSIVIHAMAGTFEGSIREFQRQPPHGKSIHYLISKTGAVVTMVPDRLVAHHAGNWAVNTTSIGIELEDGLFNRTAGYTSNPNWATLQLYQTAARLVVCLSGRYHIELNSTRVFGHRDVPNSHKADPGTFWDWNRFMNEVERVKRACLTPRQPVAFDELVGTTTLKSPSTRHPVEF